MISKLVVIACLGAASASESTKQESYVQSVHNDVWCHAHHLGMGATQCIENNGCCFSEKVNSIFQVMPIADQRALEVGPCHSCDAHTDDWCSSFGAPAADGSGEVWDNCVANSGCTYTASRGCHSSASEPLVVEHNCATYNANAKTDAYLACVDKKVIEENVAAEAAVEAACGGDEKCVEDFDKTELPKYRLFVKSGDGSECDDLEPVAARECETKNKKDGGCKDIYYYDAICDYDDEALFAPFQEDGMPNKDGSVGQHFCVDQFGHEIPDSRKQFPLDTPGIGIDCVEWRRKADGYQCPNAMTLTTRGGVVVVNEDNDALDCTQHCNTDADCGREWCCFNGCGYTCKAPVKPYAGCAAVPINHQGQTVHAVGDRSTEYSPEDELKHTMKLSVSCLPGHNVMPPSSPQAVELTCSHGRWLTAEGSQDYELKCMEQCAQFDMESTGVSLVDGLKMKSQDFIIEGDETFFGSKRTISCQPGYGVVEGNVDAVKDQKEVLTCNAAAMWINARDTERTIECSVCFDNAEWRHPVNNNNCLFYQSRVSMCEKQDDDDMTKKYSPQQENCRVSCRTCMAMEAQFGIKETRASISDVPASNKGKWFKIAKTIKKNSIRVVSEETVVEVTKQIPLTEACTDGSTTKRQNDDGSCDAGFEKMA